MILSEDKIVVTRTTYGFDNPTEHGRFAVKSVKVKVEVDDEIVYEREKTEHLIRKQSVGYSPIDCFLNYILVLNEESKSCRETKCSTNERYTNRENEGKNEMNDNYRRNQNFVIFLNVVTLAISIAAVISAILLQ